MAKHSVILSIIIPYYETKGYTEELLKVLAPQVNSKVEVLVIDDGSRKPFECSEKWCKVIRKDNGGAGSARNLGIDKAKGEYIAFIDSDDLVSNQYVNKILQKIEATKADFIDLSWKSLNRSGSQFDYLLKDDNDRLPNPSVSTRVFKRSYIGDVRFSEIKDACEDEDFSRRLGFLDDFEAKHAAINEYVYYYRTEVPNSNIKQFKQGITRTKRVAYFFEHVTKDMTYLIEEFKKEDEVNEVWLLTLRNDIPELKRYAQIIKPQPIWAHIIKGHPYNGITRIKAPIRTQVVIYRSYLYRIGGLMTFTLNFCERFKDLYDITIVGTRCEPERHKQLSSLVRVVLTDEPIYCDTMIVLSILDALPKNVHAKKIVRMCHTCKTDPAWNIPNDYDRLLFVSDTSRKSFNFDIEKCDIVHNMIKIDKRKHLLLVSATRFPAPDKGIIEDRMRILANMLNDKGISFTWLNFADGAMRNPSRNFYNMGTILNMQGMIRNATYLVQLSDSECWSYSCLEALNLGTPLICTPFPSAFEMGVWDKINAHVIPFDMNFDVEELLDVPKFTFNYDNEAIKEQWIDILGNTTPLHDYDPDELVEIEVLKSYDDMTLNQRMNVGKRLTMTKQRALQIIDRIGESYIRII